MFQSFDANEALSIKTAQKVLKNERLENDLVYIQTHFRYIFTRNYEKVRDERYAFN